MAMAARLVLIWVALMAGVVQVAAQPAAGLRVVNAGPVNEIDTLSQANEIRVVFSEPMVVLGRIPQPVRAPFFSIRPAVKGTFRWSGTTILIFTPDPGQPLPFSTDYQVSVDGTATAVSGRSLAAPFTFRFRTPTVKLLRTDFYRRQDRFDRPVVVLLRFNQPVRPADVLAHLRASHVSHDWNVPSLAPDAEARLRRLNADGLARFQAKVAAVETAARSTAAVPLRLTSDWDKKRFEPSADLVVFETAAAPPPESWIRLTLDGALPSPAGTATPGREQAYTVQLEPAFFVREVYCTRACDPSNYNPILLTQT